MPVYAVDTSFYQRDAIIPWQAMRENGFELSVHKFSMGGGPDPAAEKLVNQARAVDFDIGGYHWVDPSQSWQRQADIFLAQIHKLFPDAIFFDQEQWWSVWQKYWDWQNGKIAQNVVPQLSKASIINAGNTIIDYVLNDLIATPLPAETYTGKWFMDQYVPGPWPWPKTKRPWLAQYVVPAVSEKVCETWDEFHRVMTRLVIGRKPNVPDGLTSDMWDYWQFISSIRLPGANCSLDLSIWNGDLASYKAWLNQEPPEKWQYASLDRKLEVLYSLGRNHGKITSEGYLV